MYGLRAFVPSPAPAPRNGALALVDHRQAPSGRAKITIGLAAHFPGRETQEADVIGEEPQGVGSAQGTEGDGLQ